MSDFPESKAARAGSGPGIEAVLFDLDGTLVDHAAAAEAALAQVPGLLRERAAGQA
jgi:hypothetical protein